MATVNPAVLQSGFVLTTGNSVVVTAPALTQVIVKRAVVSNPTGGSVSFSVNRVPNAGSPVTGNIIIPTRTIAGSNTDLCPELTNMVLNPGDTLQALASAGTSLNFFASGFTNS